MAIAVHENIQTLALMGPALGYGVNLLMCWFGKKNDINLGAESDRTAEINYKKAVERLQKVKPGAKPVFSQSQLNNAGYKTYGEIQSLLIDPVQEAARRIK